MLSRHRKEETELKQKVEKTPTLCRLYIGAGSTVECKGELDPTRQSLFAVYPMLLNSSSASESVVESSKLLSQIEACQCRKSRIQGNHIAYAMLVWNHLKRFAFQAGKTIYQLKLGLLSDYLKSQLKNPSILMTLA